MTEGYIFLPRAVRPEVKKYNPRSEVDHLRIYTDKEVVLLYNFDFTPTHLPPSPPNMHNFLIHNLVILSVLRYWSST